MRRAVIIADSLWYCLCPSFRLSPLSHLPSLPPARRVSPRTCLNSALVSTVVPGRRRFAGSRASTTDDRKPEIKEDHTLADSVSSESDSTQVTKEENIPRTKSVVRRLVVRNVSQSIVARAVEDLESDLQKAASQAAPEIHLVTQILRALISLRRIQPKARHYRALIQANTASWHGSPENVRMLLNEMEENGITADSATLHAALQALAVHPDYLLRQEILRAIRDRWLSLSPTGWNSVVAGLIRDGQMEMALDRLDYMGRVGIPVQQWLHSLTIYSLCELREFDMVLILIRNRASQHYDISKDMWMHLLDEASKARHYEMACDAWKQVVDLEGLNVSSVVCAQVLTLAAKKGDPQMAESVIRFLIKAEVTPNGEDYEKLVEAYVMADDLKSAFNVLGTMHKDQIPVSERSTRSILHYMIEKRVNPANIWNRLKALKQDKVDVPVACANVVIEYCEHAYNRASHAVPQALNMALQFYKEVFELCPVGADVNTFNIMFSFCRHARRPDVCMFFVREMAALGIPPNQTTLERLILMSLEMKNFRAGFMYFLDLMERGRKLTHTTAAEIRYFCLDSQDEYACRFMSHEMVKAPVKAKTGQRFSMRYHVVSDRDSSDGKRASDESDRDGNNLESWQNPKAADDGDKNTTNVS